MKASKRREDFFISRDATLVRLVDRLKFLGRRFVHTTATGFDVARDFGEFVLVLDGPSLSALQ